MADRVSRSQRSSRARFAGALLLCLLLVAGCSRGATWQRVERSGVLLVGLDPTFPPFAMADGVPLAGLDVDLARAVAADLGLEASFVHFGYDGLYDALLTRQVDVLISAMVVEPGRTKDFAYSEAYFNAGQILVVNATDTTVSRPTDLGGGKVAVELGAEGHVEATNLVRRLPDLTVEVYNTAGEALTAVADGNADAAIVDAVSGRLFLQEQEPGNLRYLSQPVTVEPYAIVVRSEDRTLLARLNESLLRLQESGKLAQIIQEWLGP